jgi:hypothetical protein
VQLLRLAWRGLAHHWRVHAAVFAGLLVTSAVLTGSLLVGDSVRASLRAAAAARLGNVRLAVGGGDRFVRAELAAQLARSLNCDAAPLLQLRGSATAPDSGLRANTVQVLGVDPAFWDLGHVVSPFAGASDQVAINSHLARHLGVAAGDTIIVRAAKPQLLSGDAPLAALEDAGIVIRAEVAAVMDDRSFGRFSLRNQQTPPATVFVPLPQLAAAAEVEGRANLIVAGGDTTLSAAAGDAALAECWRLADLGLDLRELPGSGEIELRSRRVFIEPAIAEPATAAADGGVAILTYMVDALAHDDRRTPYSMVAAAGGRDTADVDIGVTSLTSELAADEILVNSWLADDLGVAVGDQLTLHYKVVGPMRRLLPRTHTFTVAGVTPIEGAAHDPELMPPFPGLSDAGNCRDWDAGAPLDLDGRATRPRRHPRPRRGVLGRLPRHAQSLRRIGHRPAAVAEPVWHCHGDSLSRWR